MTVSFSEGDTLKGKYRLETNLGGGGFGQVFKASNLDTGEKVAVKVPKYNAGVSETQIAKFFGRERDALEEIMDHGGHPHIMDFKEYVEVSTAPGLVIELVEGEEFGDYLSSRSTMNTAEAREFGIKLCDAVAFLHEEIEVMYRDLKPDNVMMENGEPVLIDFTTAKQYNTKIPQSPGSGGGSSDGTILGDGSKNKYKPAELTGDANVPQGPWTDVYSIGRMLLYATVKLAPSNKDYEVNVSDFGVSVDNYFDEIIVKATHRDPTERYGSAHALKRALENKEPEPPKEAELLWFSDGTRYTINPGDTIGRAYDGPTTNIELSDDVVSAVHCRFDLDSQENWVLIDKSLNGTYVKKANEPGDQWHCIRSDQGTERLRNKGHHDKADEREGETIHLDDADTIAVVNPSYGGGSDAWYRFNT